MAKKLIDQVSNEWIKQYRSILQTSFFGLLKRFIEEKFKDYDEAFKCFEKKSTKS